MGLTLHLAPSDFISSVDLFSSLSKFDIPPSFFSSFYLEPSSIEPLANCDFDDEETCGWMHDEAPWTHHWAVEQGSLCLKAKMSTSQTASKRKTSSWLRGLVNERPSEGINVNIRFASPPILATFGVKCIALVYLFNLGSGDFSKTTGVFPILSLLQQQKGCLFQL